MATDSPEPPQPTATSPGDTTASPGTPLPAKRWRGLSAHLLLPAVAALLLALVFPWPAWWPLVFLALTPLGVLAVRSARATRLGWTTWLVFFLWWLWMVAWLRPVTGPGWIAVSAFLALYPTAAALLVHWLDRRHALPLTFALPLAWVSLELVRANWPAGGFSWFLLGHALAPVEPGGGAGRLVQVAGIFGVHGVSVIPAMTAGLVGDLLTRPLVQRQGQGYRRLRRSIRWSAAICGLVLVASWSYGQRQIVQAPFAGSEKTSGPRVAVIQSNVPQSNKARPTRETDRRTWQQLARLTEAAANRSTRPDVIVWPETMVPAPINREAVARLETLAEQWRTRGDDWIRQSGQRSRYQQMADRFGVSFDELPTYMAGWYREKASYRRRIQSLCSELGIAMLVGAPYERSARRRGGVDSSVRHNSVYFIEPGAAADADEPLPRYDKLHLVPFGEYIPWIDQLGIKGWFLRWLTPYDHDYTVNPGVGPVVFDLPVRRGASTRPSKQDGSGARPATGSSPGGRLVQRVGVVTPICFEDAVGPLGARMVYAPDGTKRAPLLVNVTNDGWFAGTDQPWQHLQLATLRSIENRVPTARAVNTGVSGFIDSLGRIRTVVSEDGRSQDVAGNATAAVTLDRRRTWYQTLGRGPALGLAGITLALALGGLARRDRIKP